jgi:hypothetical protein
VRLSLRLRGRNVLVSQACILRLNSLNEWRCGAEAPEPMGAMGQALVILHLSDFRKCSVRRWKHCGRAGSGWVRIAGTIAASTAEPSSKPPIGRSPSSIAREGYRVGGGVRRPRGAMDEGDYRQAGDDDGCVPGGS